MKLTSMFGVVYFEGSIDELKFLAESEGITVKQYQEAHKNDGKSVSSNGKKPTVSGKGGSTRVTLTEEEREAKKREKAEQHKAEQKEWFNSLSETEQKEFIAKKEEQRAKRTYMQAINASRLNVDMAIKAMDASQKDSNGKVSTETYHTLFQAEMKKYGYDWTPKSK